MKGNIFVFNCVASDMLESVAESTPSVTFDLANMVTSLKGHDLQPLPKFTDLKMEKAFNIFHKYYPEWDFMECCVMDNGFQGLWSEGLVCL